MLMRIERVLYGVHSYVISKYIVYGKIKYLLYSQEQR